MAFPTAATRAGTIVVSTSERRLYYVLGNGQALRYGVGVGRPGFTWGGTKTIVAEAPNGRIGRRPPRCSSAGGPTCRAT